MADAPRSPVAAATLLVGVTGVDRPGVTTALFEALAPLGAAVLDVEQVTIRDRLVLRVLLEHGPGAAAVRAALEPLAALPGLVVDVEPGPASSGRPAPVRHVVTLLAATAGAPFPPAALAVLTGRVAAAGANIERITRLAREPVVCYELLVAGGDAQALRDGLATAAAEHTVDVAVQREGLSRRATRMVVMDVDSTLVQGEVIDTLAARAGCLAEVVAVTEAAMRGELDFAASLHQRVALLAGLPESVLDGVRRELVLMPGARTLVRTLTRLGYAVCAVSGGFTQIIAPLAAELGLTHVAANTLEITDGRITGRVLGPVVDRAGKADALRRFAAAEGVPLSQTVAVGDGANDLDMLAAAGLGIAFNAKPVVRAAADAAVSAPYLDTVLLLLGISREEVTAADDLEDHEV